MKIRYLSAVMMTMCFAAPVYAAGQGDWVVNVGWAHLEPHDKSQPMEVTAQGQTSIVPDTGSKIEKANTGMATFTYFFTDHFGLEGAVGAPPTARMKGKGSLESLGEIASAKVNSPLLSGMYYFREKDATFRPFLGAGVTYVWFSDVKLTDAYSSGEFLASPQTGNALVGPTTVKVKSQFYPIFTGGLNYQFNDKWSARLSATYVPLKVDATLTTQAPVGVVTTSAKSSLNGMVSFLSVGYKF